MSQLDFNTEIRKGKQLSITYEDRIRLETLYVVGLIPTCVVTALD